MENTSIFWRVHMAMRYTHGSGMMKMAKSVTMFREDEKVHIGIVSRHLSAMLGTIAATGIQETPKRMACTRAQMIMNARSQRHRRSALGLLVPRMRRYWRRKDILMMLLAML